MTIHEGAPGQAIALCLVPCQPEVWVAVIVCGLGGVPAVVKDIHLCTDGLGSYQEGVLRHVSRPVHLALVVDLLNHLNFACCKDSKLGALSIWRLELLFANACLAAFPTQRHQ